jgi:glyoxylase-like metal-dependent hydrolase (beta-lactamase superfamily II)
MREIKKHIFLETISYENRHMSPRNLYIIRGEERSLMVDTSNNTERDWTILKGMIDALGIDCRKLDIFITHEHPDHTGLVPKLQELGARAFMNPDETRKRVDLLHSYLADERARIENLRIVGVTKEETPEVYLHGIYDKSLRIREESAGAFLYSDPPGRYPFVWRIPF